MLSWFLLCFLWFPVLFWRFTLMFSSSFPPSVLVASLFFCVHLCVGCSLPSCVLHRILFQCLRVSPCVCFLFFLPGFFALIITVVNFATGLHFPFGCYFVLCFLCFHLICFAHLFFVKNSLFSPSPAYLLAVFVSTFGSDLWTTSKLNPNKCATLMQHTILKVTIN